MTAGKSIFDEVTAKTRHRRPDTSRVEASWIVQAVPARDQFEACTLTIEQWLANSDADEFQLEGKTEKWRVIMEASAQVLPGLLRHGGLRQAPRVGFDPIRDQPYFLFKAVNNGVTFIVSPQGMPFEDDEMFRDMIASLTPTAPP